METRSGTRRQVGEIIGFVTTGHGRCPVIVTVKLEMHPRLAFDVDRQSRIEKRENQGMCMSPELL